MVADIRALPLPAGRVDAAVAAFVLNHRTEPSAGTAEAMRAAANAAGLKSCTARGHDHVGDEPGR